MRRRVGDVVLPSLVLLVAVASWFFTAMTADHGVTERKTATGVDLGGDVHAVLRLPTVGEQLLACDGLQPQSVLARLDNAVPITEITICADDGLRRHLALRDGGQVPLLLRLFAQAWSTGDQPSPWWGSVNCPTTYPTVPSVTVRLEDGRVLAPATPVDLCGRPSPRALQAFTLVFDAAG